MMKDDFLSDKDISVDEQWQFPPSPKSVGFLLTYTCIAACKVCCFECTPKREETLSLSTALQAFDELSKLGTVETITFSGGECFLRYNDMLQIIQRAHQKGLNAKCVTNAYWATKRQIAIDKLRPLVQAGLNVIEVSTDDYHVEYVPLVRIANALEAADALGIETHLIVIGDQQTRRLHDILQELNLSFKPTVTDEFPVLPVGFAKVHIPNEQFITQDTLPSRRCGDVMRRPSITPRGELFACCAVAGFTQSLKLGDVNAVPLVEQFEQARSDPLYMILALDGPKKLATIAAEHSAFNLDQSFVNECHLCHALLSDEKVVRALREELDKNQFMYLLRRDYAETLINNKTNAGNTLQKGDTNDKSKAVVEDSC